MKTVLALATATFLFAFGSANATEISPGKMQSLILPEMSKRSPDPLLPSLI
jgi:hypothetical protein